MLPPTSDISRRTVLTVGAASVAAVLAACGSDTRPPAATEPRDTTLDRSGPDLRVVIVGAGPAGLTAAHLLRQRSVRADVLEAAATHGGRTKQVTDFVDFPIPLGAEWLHVDPAILDDAVNDDAVDITTVTVPYADDEQLAFHSGGVTELIPLIGFDGYRKFVGSSWLDFFDTYLVPGVADQITYGTQVTSIDWTGDSIVVTDASGVVREADAVIVTVPITVLRRGDIEFRPPLPMRRRRTLDRAIVWTGFKAFIEFDEAFYPAAVGFDDSLTDDGQRVYYDAAYGQDTDAHVLGLFSVGLQAERYQALSDDELRSTMLAELDAVFDGAATPAYRRHIVQNWEEEPFIAQAYLADVARPSTSRRLAEPIDDRIFFAGDGYTSFDDWGSVHTAIRSAIEAVDALMS